MNYMLTDGELRNILCIVGIAKYVVFLGGGSEFQIFIALIHPIQWTIALPVGTTGPAKRQKKTSCI